MWSAVVLIVIGALEAVTPKASRWFQEIPGPTFGISIQKSATLILSRILRLQSLW